MLRRIGDAVVADDEKAIQGTWQVDSVSDGGSKSANRLTELFPMGRRAEFSHNRIIPLDFHYDPQTIITYGLDANSRPKRFDLDRQGDRCFRGGYELKGDRLTLGWEFSSKPGTFTPTSLPETLAAGHNTVLVVLKRAAATTEKTSAGDNASEKPQAKPPAVNTAAELKALQGQWKVVRVEKGKQADSAWSTGPTGDETINLAKIHLFSFFNEDDFAMLENEQSQAPVFQYKVDPTATPKTIDFRENYPDIGKGLVALGIYELDGDQLKICLARRLPALKTEHRPKSLVIENDSRDILFHLERHRTAKDQTRIQARPKPPEKLPNAAVTAEAAPRAGGQTARRQSPGRTEGPARAVEGGAGREG